MNATPRHRQKTISRGARLALAPLLPLLLLPASCEKPAEAPSDVTVTERALVTTLFGRGGRWRYLDDGSSQGPTWVDPAFNDSAWRTGAAQLGYGEGDEATVVGYGPDASNKYITTYFRSTFNVVDRSVFVGLAIDLLYDDGVVVYLNGVEVLRVNMPQGPIQSSTRASTTISGSAENRWSRYSLPPAALAALRNGTNTLAVEVHQDAPTSSDLSFNLELQGTDTVSITRGPYLQLGTPTSAVIRWRTDVATDTRVLYGSSLMAATSVVDPRVTTEHEVSLQRLTPATQYFYAVGSTAAILAGGTDHFFYTPPVAGPPRPTRIWVLGDSGTANADQYAVRDAYRTLDPSRYTDLWLMLGDNAYQNGTDAEYQRAVFDAYPTFLRTSFLWPALGNHDTAQVSNPPANLPYFEMFTLPTAGQAGGVASGTEKYYSFDHANIHFVCLDSMSSPRAATGAMANWLRADLMANQRMWTVAFFHHPPYTKGSHDSDTAVESIDMRGAFLPILEDFGVDLVLVGHSHVYERSFLLDRHYGHSSTFTAAMKKNGGDGRPGGNGPYTKPTAGPGPHEGTVYVVAGSSGQMTPSPRGLNHPAMFLSLNRLGSLVIDVSDRRLDTRFLRETGSVDDTFTILKGDASPAPPLGLVASNVTSTTVDLSWTDASAGEQGFRIERSTDGTTFMDVGTVGANVTTHTAAGLSPGTVYFFRVRSFGAGGSAGVSNVVRIVTTSCTPEICDDRDNDCNGRPDDPFTDKGMACSAGLGACLRTGTRVCAPGGAATTCSAIPGPPAPEVCGDGVDNDCNGATDETCTIEPGPRPEPPPTDAAVDTPPDAPPDSPTDSPTDTPPDAPESDIVDAWLPPPPPPPDTMPAAIDTPVDTPAPEIDAPVDAPAAPDTLILPDEPPVDTPAPVVVDQALPPDTAPDVAADAPEDAPAVVTPDGPGLVIIPPSPPDSAAIADLPVAVLPPDAPVVFADARAFADAPLSFGSPDAAADGRGALSAPDAAASRDDGAAGAGGDAAAAEDGFAGGDGGGARDGRLDGRDGPPASSANLTLARRRGCACDVGAREVEGPPLAAAALALLAVALSRRRARRDRV